MKEFRTPLIRILELDQGLLCQGSPQPCKMAFANVDMPEFVLRYKEDWLSVMNSFKADDIIR